MDNKMRPEGTHKREGKILRLWAAQDGKCYYCGCEMQLFRNTRKFPLPENFATKDHVLPKNMGGTGEIKNLVAACSKCNSARGSMPVSEFKLKFNPSPQQQK